MIVEMEKFNEKYPYFQGRYPNYSNAKVVINDMIKSTNMVIKEKSRIISYYQTTIDSI